MRNIWKNKITFFKKRFDSVNFRSSTDLMLRVVYSEMLTTWESWRTRLFLKGFRSYSVLRNWPTPGPIKRASGRYTKGAVEAILPFWGMQVGHSKLSPHNRYSNFRTDRLYSPVFLQISCLPNFANCLRNRQRGERIPWSPYFGKVF